MRIYVATEDEQAPNRSINCSRDLCAYMYECRIPSRRRRSSYKFVYLPEIVMHPIALEFVRETFVCTCPVRLSKVYEERR